MIHSPEMIEVFRIRRAQILDSLQQIKTPFLSTWTVQRMGADNMAQIKVRLSTPVGPLEGFAGLKIEEIDERRTYECAKDAVLRAMGLCFDRMNPGMLNFQPPPVEIYARPERGPRRIRL